MMCQIVGDPFAQVPCLGASGAIAAVMGAFLVTYPRDRIRTVVFFLIFVRITFIPAALLIGFWFLMQILNFGTVARVTPEASLISPTLADFSSVSRPHASWSDPPGRRLYSPTELDQRLPELVGVSGRSSRQPASFAAFRPVRMQSGMPMPSYALPARRRPGSAADAFLHALHPLLMTNGILGHCASPTRNLRCLRRNMRPDDTRAQNLAEFAPHSCDQHIVSLIQQSFVLCTA